MPYRQAPQPRSNPTPYKALARVTDCDGLFFFREAGFHATPAEADAAARAEARRLDYEIPCNDRLQLDNCRPVAIDWGHSFWPYLDADGKPAKETP